MRLCWRDIRPSFLKYNSKTTAIPEIIPVVLICTAGIILTRPDSSPACSFAPQGLFLPAGCISILLFCSTGIISAGRMHLYLALFFHRDYFRRSDASLSSSFASQGLFLPVGFIPSLLFCSTGIIYAGRMHLYLPLLLHRDYFHRPDASLPSSFVPQGLFRPTRCISAFLFCPTGIISTARIHLYLPLLLHRDDFAPVRCISILLFSSTGMISAIRIHLYLPLLLHRDDFAPAGCISILLFCYTGIISAGRMHLYLPLLLHRDDFCRSDASLSCSFVTQGLFRPARCISILLFCYTEIISTVRMHLYLALLLHRDYFRRPDSSLPCSFSPQG